MQIVKEKIAEIQHKIDFIRNQGDNFADKLEKLRKAYSEIKQNGDKNLPSQFKEEASLIHDRIEKVVKDVGDTPLRNMSLAQLQEVYDMYKMVLTTIRNATRILVLTENGIEESGTHEELLASNQIYQEVYRSQQKGGLEKRTMLLGPLCPFPFRCDLCQREMDFYI